LCIQLQRSHFRIRKSATHRLHALSRDPRAPHGEGAALLG
jgi:hypothetical protein